MLIYLVQHGEAKGKDADPDRHLTDRGREDVGRMAAYLEMVGVEVQAIWHSGKPRAEQTAGVLAEALGAARGVARRDGLGPNDPAAPVAKALAKARRDVMIVGHLPFLGKLASLLVAGDEGADLVAFQYGCVVCIERAGGAARLRWMLTPERIP